MPRYLLPLIALILLAAACGDDDSPQPEDQSATPLPTLDAEHATWSSIYMRLGEARQFVQDLGVAGTTLAPTNYECIQSECPAEAPGDDSYGCLSILPTGDPVNVDSLYPADPPGWYSITWNGAFGETYGAPPEPVVNQRHVELDPIEDIACGARSKRQMTAGEAVAHLEAIGLDGLWENPHSEEPDPTCVPDADCPIPGITASTEGCLSLSIFELPHYGPGQAEPSVDVYVSWFSGGNADSPDGIQFLYSQRRFLKDVEATLKPGIDEDCLTLRGGRPNRYDVYDRVPYTDVLEITEWRLTQAPTGSTLELTVAIGGNCETFERVSVDETETSVSIDAYRRHSTPGPNEGCTEPLSHEAVTVELETPLGDRALVGCDPLPDAYYYDNVNNCAEPIH